MKVNLTLVNSSTFIVSISLYRSSSVVFFNSVIPTQNFPQSRNPDGDLAPSSPAYFPSRISSRFCGKIPNPSNLATPGYNVRRKTQLKHIDPQAPQALYGSSLKCLSTTRNPTYDKTASKGLQKRTDRKAHNKHKLSHFYCEIFFFKDII